MITLAVGQTWIHKKRGIELYVEALLPMSRGLRARWKNTTGFVSLETLSRNYRYDRIEPQVVLEPFGLLYADMSTAIIHRLEAMDDAELISTLDAADTLDDHCWWATWQVRDEVRQEARRILTHHRAAFDRSGCGRIDQHDPHMWDCHGGSHIPSPGHYYCKGPGVREGAMRHYHVPVRVNV